jgi:hypothetical protein
MVLLTIKLKCEFIDKQNQSNGRAMFVFRRLPHPAGTDRVDTIVLTFSSLVLIEKTLGARAAKQV